MFLIFRIILSYPHLSRFEKFTEPLYWKIILLLESFYLFYYQATVAQNFYDLHMIETESLMIPPRFSKTGQPKRKKLTKRGLMAGLLYTVGLPLLRAKLQEWYENKREERSTAAYRTREALPDFTDATQPPDVRIQSFKRFVEDAIVDAFPFLWAGEQFACLAYNLAFLLNPYKYPYWDPYLHASGMCVRLNANLVSNGNGSHDMRRKGWFERFREMDNRQKMTSLTGAFVRGMAMGALHTLRILEWWYANEEKLQNKQGSTAIPCPPPTPKIRASHIMLPTDTKLCPLCNEEKTNPACTTSGFVFCYPCIVGYVRENMRCPITELPTREEDIRRLFFNSS